ncbi:chromosome partitioning protein MukE [Candidatus Williamhamiltonella defendens]|uniref:Chromosome partitioning protein MukE n=2 Tax=Candidatus Williamhamiltonella defendens TaxID=138072 RepID=A0A2D3T6K9_9ENTR|nr:chromosome partition protein MukE [Candidatus Hamiltonella defensa]ASV33587.1 condensin subunit E [Candidatus Hamiltonella defensa]ATW22977.1 chromosome partitioning protein MukE [Candidatus Hamiltonella defensa]ATW29434.1 chromosome partitioning protein MukE [Candidatus Hamiltonella defensa]ATW31417.1 chromosome partitioning protein MukE [Candidatus Hamiltonella defensa]MBK4360918.1 chromosome partition protein MukE [Candidatus Hamiltonella defensa]
MSSINIEHIMPVKLAQALSNPLFPNLDSQLRSGRHVGMDELENHCFLMDFQEPLETFYRRYHVELIRAPEGFFYLRPRSSTLIPRSVLSELDMILGKILCYLYLSPERLNNQGIFSEQELYEELITLSDEKKLFKCINQRSTGSDLDKQKLQERVRTSLNRLRRLGMVYFIENDKQKFVINAAVFRFGADIRHDEDLPAAQLRLIQQGEAVDLLNPEKMQVFTPNDLPDETPNEHRTQTKDEEE